jgi:hypothetical protein
MQNCRAQLRLPTNLASDALALEDKEPLRHEIFHSWQKIKKPGEK